MTEEFNKWWDEDLLTENNPFVDGTPAYWAWEGWCAGVKAERNSWPAEMEAMERQVNILTDALAKEREACAKVCDDNDPGDGSGYSTACEALAEDIRARGNT